MIDSIGGRVRDLRDRFGKNRDDFATELGISKSTLVRYESNERKPDADFLMALYEKYNISIHWILFGESDPDNPSEEEQDRHLYEIHEMFVVGILRQLPPAVVESLCHFLLSIIRSRSN